MHRIVIFANGELNQPKRLKTRLRSGDRIFCADGGTLNALAVGFTPEVIVGDLDSLPKATVKQMEAAGVTFHRFPANKDFTDLELALNLAVAEKPDEIGLVTALGGRLDQMLANILLLTRPEYSHCRIRLLDGTTQAMLLRSGQQLTLAGQPGDTLSLVPLTAPVTQITLKGVRWPLDKATLSLGHTRSISNQFVGSQAQIQIGAGMALVVHIKAEP